MMYNTYGVITFESVVFEKIILKFLIKLKKRVILKSVNLFNLLIAKFD